MEEYNFIPVRKGKGLPLMADGIRITRMSIQLGELVVQRLQNYVREADKIRVINVGFDVDPFRKAIKVYGDKDGYSLNIQQSGSAANMVPAALNRESFYGDFLPKQIEGETIYVKSDHIDDVDLQPIDTLSDRGIMVGDKVRWFSKVGTDQAPMLVEGKVVKLYETDSRKLARIQVASREYLEFYEGRRFTSILVSNLRRMD